MSDELRSPRAILQELTIVLAQIPIPSQIFENATASLALQRVYDNIEFGLAQIETFLNTDMDVLFPVPDDSYEALAQRLEEAINITLTLHTDSKSECLH